MPRKKDVAVLKLALEELLTERDIDMKANNLKFIYTYEWDEKPEDAIEVEVPADAAEKIGDKPIQNPRPIDGEIIMEGSPYQIRKNRRKKIYELRKAIARIEAQE